MVFSREHEIQKNHCDRISAMPSGIIRVHPVDPCSNSRSTPRSIAIAIGFAIAIETLWLSLSAVPTAQVESTNPKRIIRIESHPCLQLSSAFILTIHVPDTGSTPRSIAIAIGIAIAIAIEISRLSDTKFKGAVWLPHSGRHPGQPTGNESIAIPIAIAIARRMDAGRRYTGRTWLRVAYRAKHNASHACRFEVSPQQPGRDGLFENSQITILMISILLHFNRD